MRSITRLLSMEIVIVWHGMLLAEKEVVLDLPQQTTTKELLELFVKLTKEGLFSTIIHFPWLTTSTQDDCGTGRVYNNIKVKQTILTFTFPQMEVGYNLESLRNFPGF